MHEIGECLRKTVGVYVSDYPNGANIFYDMYIHTKHCLYLVFVRRTGFYVYFDRIVTDETV